MFVSIKYSIKIKVVKPLLHWRFYISRSNTRKENPIPIMTLTNLAKGKIFFLLVFPFVLHVQVVQCPNYILIQFKIGFGAPKF